MMKKIYSGLIKRMLDILLCSLALIFFSPIFLITAIAIKLSSPGPAFYYSIRTGKDKRPFQFYKFRSMHVTANDKGMYVADADRLFMVGKVIRRLKIDELPQLLNVIKGDMSIVGPRPMPFDSVDRTYYGDYQRILSIKPGLTSAASLFDYTVGDTYTDNDAYMKEVLPYKLEMEMLYIAKESFLYDLSLIWRTVGTIFAVLFRCNTLPKQWEYEYVKNSIKTQDFENNMEE